MNNITQIDYKFGKSQMIVINGKSIRATHYNKYSRLNAFDPTKKVFFIEMAIFNKKNIISKIAVFANYNNGKEYIHIRTRKA